MMWLRLRSGWLVKNINAMRHYLDALRGVAHVVINDDWETTKEEINQIVKQVVQE